MITAGDKKLIREIMQSPGFSSLEAFKDAVVKNLNEQSRLGENEWDTLKNTLLIEGQMMGINHLWQEMYKTQQ